MKNSSAISFVTLQTKRLILQGLSPEDMYFIFENLPKEEIKKVLGHRSDEDYQAEEKKHKNGYSSYNRSFKLFLIREKETNAIIGRCGIHNWNTDHRRAEVGYILTDESQKRKGYMTEALEAVISYGFNQLNLNRLEALVGAENTASLRLMAKNRFIQEGVLRKHHFSNGIFEDSLVFSKLREEYNAESSS